MSQVLEASREHPYLSVRLELDPQVVSSVIVEAGHTFSPRRPIDVRALDINPLDTDLLETVVRIVRLLNAPDDAPILLPMLTREIVYRLLKSVQGPRPHHLALSGGYTPQIIKAVAQLREEFDQPLRIDELGHELGMSVAGFHYHFKAVAALSPLQFQKQPRLLMISEVLDATSTAYRVGYNDASQFNREYKSLFGVPPMRDVQLRETSIAVPG